MKVARSVVGLLGAVAVVGGCSRNVVEDGVELGRTPIVVEPAGGKTTSPQLNLSHIACAEDGSVTVHFVLLFWGASTPPDLNGTSNQGAFTAAPGKNTGNVWHYNATLHAGDVEITTASVGSIALHNPGEYSGNYACGPESPECPVQVSAGSFCASASTLGNPGAECGSLGLAWTSGKDDNVNAAWIAATERAYVAIVKGGNGNSCPRGEASYNVYVNVSAGDTLVTGNGTNVSHVTYCACPAP